MPYHVNAPHYLFAGVYDDENAQPPSPLSTPAARLAQSAYGCPHEREKKKRKVKSPPPQGTSEDQAEGRVTRWRGPHTKLSSMRQAKYSYRCRPTATLPPRETPNKRKVYHRVDPPNIDALDLAGPSSLEISSGDILNLESSDDDTDEGNDHPTRPLPARSRREMSTTPAPSASAQSPPPQSELDVDEHMSDDDDMNGNQPPPPGNPPPPYPLGNPPQLPANNPPPLPANNPLPQPLGNPPQPLGNQPLLQIGNPNGGQPAPPPPLPFVLPTARALDDGQPGAWDCNPHLRFETAGTAPPVDTELGRSVVQQNTGQFRAHIMTNKRLYQGIAPAQVADFEESPYHKIALVIANGGDYVLSRVKYKTPLDIQIERVLHWFAPVGRLIIRLPLPDPDASGGGKYGGPATVLVEVENDAGAAAITSQAVFGVHNLLGFWAHDVKANKTTKVWTFGHWDMVRPGGDKARIEAYARAAFILAAFANGDIYRLIDRLTQVLGGDARRRVFHALSTTHFELLQHPEKPVVVGYMEPLTTNDAEQLNQLLRGLSFNAGNFGFTAWLKNGYAPECAYCKATNHPAFHCPYTQPELGFWGPVAQISDPPPRPPMRPAVTK
ncbi:hypothetical protein DFH09DRAFT_1338545 [Mycena vulgaris]|nr:hypothetical protein DFH09DRAFT_1338545 [Mycena vulgaris]